MSELQPQKADFSCLKRLLHGARAVHFSGVHMSIVESSI